MTPGNAPALDHRLDYLDAVRAFALLLGIVFHSSLSFAPYLEWAVMDPANSLIVAGFALVSHSFRMHLFFLIAGFFSHMTFRRKGAGSFVTSRLIRIAIPFVIGWFLLRPLIVSAWVMGAESMRGEVHVVSGLKVGFQSLRQLPQNLLIGTHLWFLYYLLLVTAIALAARTLLDLAPSLRSKATRWTDATVAQIATSGYSWPALALPTAACVWLMSGWGMDTPDESLIPHLPVLVIYGAFFTLGWLLHRQEELIGRFAQLSKGRFALGITSVALSLALSMFQFDSGHPLLGLIRAGFTLSYAVMMWSLVGLSIGLFQRFLDRPNKTVRFIADASYWLYLIHLPIVIWLQIAVSRLSFHWSLKLIAISVLTIGLSLVLYDLVVRSTFIGMTLNGRKKERVFFRWE
jgi:peptidoglycan/LPS O-acetylase OafA/YrhL